MNATGKPSAANARIGRNPRILAIRHPDECFLTAPDVAPTVTCENLRDLPSAQTVDRRDRGRSGKRGRLKLQPSTPREDRRATASGSPRSSSIATLELASEAQLARQAGLPSDELTEEYRDCGRPDLVGGL